MTFSGKTYRRRVWHLFARVQKFRKFWRIPLVGREKEASAQRQSASGTMAVFSGEGFPHRNWHLFEPAQWWRYRPEVFGEKATLFSRLFGPDFRQKNAWQLSVSLGGGASTINIYARRGAVLVIDTQAEYQGEKCRVSYMVTMLLGQRASGRLVFLPKPRFFQRYSPFLEITPSAFFFAGASVCVFYLGFSVPVLLSFRAFLRLPKLGRRRSDYKCRAVFKK